jgi:type II secretory pathway pseudopilin PulG
MNQDGWSAVELTLVAGLMVILVSSMVPSIQRTLEQSRLDTAAYSFSSDLQLARIQALKKNTAITVNVNTQASSWGILGIGTRYLPHTISFGTQTPSAFSFDSRGRSTASTQQTVTLSNSLGQTRSIVLTPIGKITVN